MNKAAAESWAVGVSTPNTSHACHPARTLTNTRSGGPHSSLKDTRRPCNRIWKSRLAMSAAAATVLAQAAPHTSLHTHFCLHGCGHCTLLLDSWLLPFFKVTQSDSLCNKHTHWHIHSTDHPYYYTLHQPHACSPLSPPTGCLYGGLRKKRPWSDMCTRRRHHRCHPKNIGVSMAGLP